MLFRGESADFGNDQLTVAGNIVHPYEVQPVIGLSAASTSQSVFIADAAYQLVSVKESHTVASSSGTLQVQKCTGTQAPGSGTNLLTGTISLAGAANTTLSGTLVSTTAINLAAGDRLALVIGGTMTSYANGLVSLVLRRI